MRSRLGWRARIAALVSTVAVVGGGFTVASTLTAGAATEQKGYNNYAGPKACADAAIAFGVVFDNCTNATDVIQTSTPPEGVTTGGRNVFEAQGAESTVVQQSVGESAKNDAFCIQSTTENIQNLSCSVTQTGDGGNTVTTKMAARPDVENVVDTDDKPIVQRNEVRLIVNQQSKSGDNTVTGPASDPDTECNGGPVACPGLTIDQRARQEVSTETPLLHQQDSFGLASITQNATTTGDNTVTLRVNRAQDSFTRGTRPTQKQDTWEATAAVMPPLAEGIPSAEGLCQNAARNGNVCLLQRTDSGTQNTTIRGLDTKTADATDISLANQSAQQQQGPNPETIGIGGWVVEVDMDQGPDGKGHVDLGDADACPPPDTRTDCSEIAGDPGIAKEWTLSASNVVGGQIGGASSQYDGIIENLIGKSPRTGESAGWTKLAGRPGTTQIANLDAVGHTKEGWKGFIAAQLNDFGDRVNFNNQGFVSEHIGCDDIVDTPGSSTCSNVTTSPATFSATEGNSATGTVARFTSDNPNDTAGSFTADVDWGDGSSSAGTVGGGPGDFTVAGTHTYADDGSYPVQVTILRSGKQVGAVTSAAEVANGALAASGTTVEAVLGVEFTGAVATFTNGNPAEGAETHEATIHWGDGTSSPADGKAVSIVANEGGGFTVKGTHRYTAAGKRTIRTTITEEDGASAFATSTVTPVAASCPATGGCFVIGRPGGQAAVDSAAYFWGNDWAPNNIPAPSSFKGFAASPSGACANLGKTWTTSGGTSPPPADTLPQYMAVIVASEASKNGSEITGDIKQVVVVKTDPGYKPTSGSVGTGTVIATLCG